MKLLPEEMSSISEERDFLPSPIERMIRLFDVLDGFAGDEVMGPRMALFGGTALNIVHATEFREPTPLANRAVLRVRSTGISEGHVE